MQDIRVATAALVKEMRDELDSAAYVDRTHTREVDGGDVAFSIQGHQNLGGKKFTHRFVGYLDNPPRLLLIHRNRRWPIWHYRHRHPEKRESGTWSICQAKPAPCKERLGWRLLQCVVLEEQSIEGAISGYKLTVDFGFVVLYNELQTVLNAWRRTEGHAQ